MLAFGFGAPDADAIDHALKVDDEIVIGAFGFALVAFKRLENNLDAIDGGKNERNRLAGGRRAVAKLAHQGFGCMKRETEEAWASERVENALLRERINDVAAEVARLASALEGPNSPIDSLLAAETSHERISSVPESGGQSDLTESPNNGNLADRIRALQTHASRLAQATDDKTRN